LQLRDICFSRSVVAEIFSDGNWRTKIAPITPKTPVRHRKRISCVILVPTALTSSSRVEQFSPKLLLHALICKAAVVVSATQCKVLSFPLFFILTNILSVQYIGLSNFILIYLSNNYLNYFNFLKLLISIRSFCQIYIICERINRELRTFAS